MQEVYDFIRSAKFYSLATADGDQPKVRPFGTVDIFEGRLYVQCGKAKDVYKQLLANPKAEICAVNGGEWLRITGKLIPDERREAKKHMLDAFPHLRSMYSEDDDNTIVLYFSEAKATFYKMASPVKTTEL